MVECMCKDVVHLNPFWWLQMIPTHCFSSLYWRSCHPRPNILTAFPCAPGDDHEVGEKKAFRSLTLAPRGGVNDGGLWLKLLAKEAFNVF